MRMYNSITIRIRICDSVNTRIHMLITHRMGRRNPPPKGQKLKVVIQRWTLPVTRLIKVFPWTGVSHDNVQAPAVMSLGDWPAPKQGFFGSLPSTGVKHCGKVQWKAAGRKTSQPPNSVQEYPADQSLSLGANVAIPYISTLRECFVEIVNF